MRHALFARFCYFEGINHRGVPDFRLMTFAQFVSRREINDFAGFRTKDADYQRTRPSGASVLKTTLCRNEIMHF